MSVVFTVISEIDHFLTGGESWSWLEL